MMPQAASKFPSFYETWASALTGMLEFQWWLCQIPIKTGMEIMQVFSNAPDVVAPAAGQSRDAADVRELEKLAIERARRGLAPPRQIYQAPYRDQIDWSQFPEWARALDPEMFEEVGHEG
jgi:hypothetical protein